MKATLGFVVLLLLCFFLATCGSKKGAKDKADNSADVLTDTTPDVSGAISAVIPTGTGANTNPLPTGNTLPTGALPANNNAGTIPASNTTTPVSPPAASLPEEIRKVGFSENTDSPNAELGDADVKIENTGSDVTFTVLNFSKTCGAALKVNFAYTGATKSFEMKITESGAGADASCIKYQTVSLTVIKEKGFPGNPSAVKVAIFKGETLYFSLADYDLTTPGVYQGNSLTTPSSGNGDSTDDTSDSSDDTSDPSDDTSDPSDDTSDPSDDTSDSSDDEGELPDSY